MEQKTKETKENGGGRQETKDTGMEDGGWRRGMDQETKEEMTETGSGRQRSPVLMIEEWKRDMEGETKKTKANGGGR